MEASTPGAAGDDTATGDEAAVAPDDVEPDVDVDEAAAVADDSNGEQQSA